MRTTARTAIRLLTVMVVVATLLVGSVGCASGGTKVTIFTGGTAGVYFPLGSKYAEMLNQHSDKIDANAVTSGASVTNAKAIGTNECQAALLQNDVSYYAVTGTTAMFDTAVPQLRGLACLYPETIQFVVLDDSPIMTLADLAGKNVAVGAPGSGTAVACEQILSAAGVWSSITRFDLNFAEAASAIKLGEVDAGIILAGAPTPAIEELAISSPVRIIDVPADILTKLLAAGYPFYVQQSLAAGTYGMDNGVTTVAVQAMLAVRNDLPEDVVYDMTKILFTQLNELKTAHTKGSEVSLQTALDGMSLVLHPGAVKYYKEAGVTVPAAMQG